MKKLDVEVVQTFTTTVQIDVWDDYEWDGHATDLIRDGDYRTISHTIVPGVTYTVIREEIVKDA